MKKQIDSVTCDICVVGSGAGGLSTALAAHSAGLQVVLIEKESVFGGTSCYSAGAVWIPLSDESKRAGVEDSKDKVLQYLQNHVGESLDRENAEAYLEAAPRMLREYQELGFLAMDYAGYWADYHPKEEGGVNGGRTLTTRPFDGRKLGKWFEKLRPPPSSMMAMGGMMLDIMDMPHVFRLTRSTASAKYMAKLAARYARDRLRYSRGTRLANGNAMIARLAAAVLARDIPFWLDCGLTELIREGDAVRGAVVSRDGVEVNIHTRKGVILATGGYPRDQERLAHTHPHIARGQEHVILPPAGNTGEGIRAAESSGADFRNSGRHPAAWTPVSLLPGKQGEDVPFPHFIDRGKPGYISVTTKGKRFVSESSSYHIFGAAMIAACEEQNACEAWNICDHDSIRRFGMGALGPSPTPIRSYLKSGYIRKADTIEKLAQICGIDTAGLQETIKEFNGFCANGKDPEFNRGEDAYETFNGLPSLRPNPCLAPVRQPPFYAVKMGVAELGTLSGLATDHSAHVLRSDKTAISGLYAVGNDAASLFGGTYPGSGICLGPALTFGYLAAQAATRD